MTAFTRLTLSGATRRAEVVVADAEPLGSALPQLLDLLGEAGGTVARPLSLVTADGEPVDIARTPSQLQLRDGTLLRLVRLDAAPPPPVVIDVTDAAADALEIRADRWDARARMSAGGTAIAIAAALAATLPPYGDDVAAAWWMLGGLVALLAIAAGLGLGGVRGSATCAAAAAAGLVPALALAATTASGPLTAAAVALASAGLVVLVGIGVARRNRGAAAGGALGGVLGTLLLILLLVGVPPTAAAAVVAVVAGFATGPLPWIALSAAGLTELDQRAADGDPATRARAAAAIDDAYASLSWSVAFVAAAIGVAGVSLVLAAELWAGLLALAVALVAAMRTRAFPLRMQGWTLWTAVAAIAVAAVVLLDGWVGSAVSAGSAIVIAFVVLAQPRPHTRARLRGLGNVLETLAVVSLLPLLLGALGVYAELLGMFGG
ncbi:hypothetical protein GCM10022200_22930 [Microbacterium awajiense]|uniref:EccD-like transmembrane domain-containing protein n=1 Tax=Microbacterium awajiense TaxID=415214 RepID=A0ABP7ARH8_9MICO